MAYTDVNSGEDILIEISLTDDDGNEISIDDLSELYVFVVCDADESILKKFNKAGTGEYTALIKDTEYEYHAWLESSETKGLNGKYRLEIMMQETEAELSDTKRETIEGNIDGFRFNPNTRIKELIT
jgi:hypothetical protein